MKKIIFLERFFISMIFRSFTRILALILGMVLIPPLVNSHDQPHEEDLAIGIVERLGQNISLDLIFFDEDGKTVPLRPLIHTPTFLVPVYYSCPDICNYLLYHLAQTLQPLSAEPGKEFKILAISFDETEKAGLANEKKEFYLKMIDRPFPKEAWRFLTGDKENIKRLMDSIGFHFKREGKTFQHPVALIVLSPDGKITRYIYGMDFLPFDLKMAILEASQGRIGPTINKVLRFCFSYDPKGRRYVFNTLKVTGVVTLVCAFAFIFFLVFRSRKRKPEER